LTPNADIVSVDFCKSIIRSVASLSYQEAQNIHDDPHAQDAVAQVGRKEGKGTQAEMEGRSECAGFGGRWMEGSGMPKEARECSADLTATAPQIQVTFYIDGA